MRPTIAAFTPQFDTDPDTIVLKKPYFVPDERTLQIILHVKRIFLHIAFWLAYMAEDIALIYLWDKGRFDATYSTGHQLMLAFFNSLSSMIPRLFFTYFLLYYILPGLLGNRKRRPAYVTLLFIAWVASTAVYRAIGVYFQNPVIYHNTLNYGPYFSGGWFIQMSMDIGFVAGVAVMIKQFRLQLADKQMHNDLVRDKLETELKFLRNQTNPHFLFNTLNNIYALARKKSDETADVVMKLSKLLRFMLYETKKEQIRISDEIKILDDYIELEKLRYNDRLTVSFIREIDNEHEQIAPLLLIPFVENAFKHGASESRFESFVNLEMSLQNGILDFSIENTKEQNGKGPNDENIGLTNVRRQLELLYRTHEVSIQCEESLYKVHLIINLREYANL
ncbi:MAG TPA: histidine kinase [Puia sp.]|nr:histidine kinase [Puia sp.]